MWRPNDNTPMISLLWLIFVGKEVNDYDYDQNGDYVWADLAYTYSGWLCVWSESLSYNFKRVLDEDITWDKI